jgi:hypothetical protein
MWARGFSGPGLLALLSVAGCDGWPGPGSASSEWAPAPMTGVTPWAPPLQRPSPELESAVLAIESASESESAPLSQDEMLQVLEYHCGACHLPIELELAQDGFSSIHDLDLMILTGKVLPGDGEASRIVQRMRLEEMPPLSSGIPYVPPVVVDRIVRYIDALPPERPLD